MVFRGHQLKLHNMCQRYGEFFDEEWETRRQQHERERDCRHAELAPRVAQPDPVAEEWNNTGTQVRAALMRHLLTVEQRL